MNLHPWIPQPPTPAHTKMVSSPFHVKPFQSLHVFSMKVQFSSPKSLKIKTLIHSHIFHHFWQLLRTLTKAKSMFIQLLSKNKNKNKNKNKSYYFETMKNRKNKFLISSFRMHYNWSSSHVTPMPESVVYEFDTTQDYYDSTWNSIVQTDDCQGELDSQLSGYLNWLDEKAPGDSSSGSMDGDMYEIDKLADQFIASCHEKFRLEKQESYRRYQEMLARGM